MKKYFAELIGTFVLVLFGCGSAVVAGGSLGVFGIAMAFGLSIVAMAYVIGPISSCHINPAVSLAMLISGKMKFLDFIGYVIAQVAGALAAAAIILFIVRSSNLDLAFGTNGFGAVSAVNITMLGAIIVEIILTFVFVFTILGVTSSEKTSKVAGLVIGLTLAFVHILGINLTGTSVNPARSLGPAIFAGGIALQQVWVFIVAPFVGAALAALVFKLFSPKAKPAL
ncbi:MAG: MIP family channel protein [Clostridia bacterium]|nr:MIP family channel protein [Clostridia bacterium]MBT7122259.1 MIP family channel protein [Clostridia bacterium]